MDVTGVTIQHGGDQFLADAQARNANSDTSGDAFDDEMEAALLGQYPNIRSIRMHFRPGREIEVALDVSYALNEPHVPGATQQEEANIKELYRTIYSRGTFWRK